MQVLGEMGVNVAMHQATAAAKLPAREASKEKATKRKSSLSIPGGAVSSPKTPGPSSTLNGATFRKLAVSLNVLSTGARWKTLAAAKRLRFSSVSLLSRSSLLLSWLSSLLVCFPAAFPAQGGGLAGACAGDRGDNQAVRVLARHAVSHP